MGGNEDLIAQNLVDKLDINISDAKLRESVQVGVLDALIRKSDNNQPQLTQEELDMTNRVYKKVRAMLNKEIN